MRSSYYPIGKGKGEFSADANEIELEPLLEEGSAFDGMDDIDLDEVATEKVSQLPPDLLEQIHDAIQRITLAESKFSQPQSYISNLRKFRIYLSLTLITGITVIVAPSIAFTVFRNHFFKSGNETSLPHELELLNNDYEILPVLQAQKYENFNRFELVEKNWTRVMGKYYDSWRNPHFFSGQTQSCMETTPDIVKQCEYVDAPTFMFAAQYRDDIFCYINKPPHINPVPQCMPIVRQACNASLSYSNMLNSVVTAYNDYSFSYVDVINTEYDIRRLQRAISRHSSFELLKLDNIIPLCVPVLSVLLGSVIFLVLTIRRKRDLSGSKTEVDQHYTGKLKEYLQESPDLQSLLNHLGIQINTIAEVITALKLQAEPLKARRDARVAFLGIGHRKNRTSALHGLFNQFDRHIRKYILQHAGLLPTANMPVAVESVVTEVAIKKPMQDMATIEDYATYPLHSAEVNLQALISAIRHRDAAYLQAWREQGYQLSWRDHRTNKTLLEHLGNDGDLGAIKFVYQFYCNYSFPPDLSDAVKGAAAANRSPNMLIGIPNFRHCYGVALEGARAGEHQELLNFIMLQIGGVRAAKYTNDIARGAAYACDEPALIAYLEAFDDTSPILHHILQGLVMGGHDKLVIPYLENALDKDYLQHCLTVVAAAAGIGNTALICHLIFTVNEQDVEENFVRELVALAIITASEHAQIALLNDMLAYAKLLGMNLKAANSPLHAALRMCIESHRFHIAKHLLSQGARIDYALEPHRIRYYSEAEFIRIFRGMNEPMLCLAFVNLYDADVEDDDKKISPLLKFAYHLQDLDDADFARALASMEQTSINMEPEHHFVEIKNHLLNCITEYLQSPCKRQGSRAVDLYDVLCMLNSPDSIRIILERELKLMQNKTARPASTKTNTVFARLAASPHAFKHSFFHRSYPDFISLLERCISIISHYRPAHASRCIY